MSNLSGITSAPIRDLMGNRSTAKAILAINAASAATVKTTGALAYTVDGIQYAKAILAAQSIAVTHDANGNPAAGGYVQPADTIAYLTLGVNAAGAISVSQGSYLGQDVSLGQAGTTAVGNGRVPPAPSGFTPFGLIKVMVGAATFTPGVTALDAANVTASYFDIAVLPAGAP